MKKQTRRSKSQKASSKTKAVYKTKSKASKKSNQQHEQQPHQIEEAPIDKNYKFTHESSTIKVTLHKAYTKQVSPQQLIKYKNWYTLFLEKERRRNLAVFHVSKFSYYPAFEFQLAGENPEHSKCSICQFQYESLEDAEIEKQLLNQSDGDIVILQCSHIMHYGCLKMLIGEKQWLKCPICSTIYGVMIGDQPPGEMTWTKNNFSSCDGYPECGTITITYRMHSGKRGNISFPGTTRVAYLPDNAQGNQVLQLLHQAFKRKLIFTIGHSVTLGRDNLIVWNGIHHKTNTSGGSSHFGYPDPTYFDRVKLELAAKGVTAQH